MGDTDRTEPERRPGPRRRAREVALAALYRADLLDLGYAAALASLPEMLSLHEESRPEPERRARSIRAEALQYAHGLVTGVSLESERIDATIAELSTDWSLDRLSVTDRNILRLALWELGNGEPPGVAINEAVEIAQEYGGAESSKFVNGVLGAWVKRESAGGDVTDDGGET